MSLLDELKLATEIIEKAKDQGIQLQGPAETEYEYGWIPTVTIWHNERRVHFHYSFSGGTKLSDKRTDVLTLEVEFSDDRQLPARTPIRTFEDSWDVVQKFLIQGLMVSEIPREWVSDTSDVNKFIPHPPSTFNPANIVSVLSQGNWTPWHPPEKKKPQNFFSRWFRKR
jgi:hypothetical protein